MANAGGLTKSVKGIRCAMGFLINSVIGGADPSALNVVLNWQAGLSR